jgi:hypothetical protein
MKASDLRPGEVQELSDAELAEGFSEIGPSRQAE